MSNSVRMISFWFLVAILSVFVYSNASAQTWYWTDTIQPITQEDLELIKPRQCEGEEKCFTWNTYLDGPERPIWMDVVCQTDGVSIGENGQEVYTVPAGMQLVAAFTARRCEPEGTPTPPTSTETPSPEPTETPTPTVGPGPEVPTATPQPWATSGWQSVVRPTNGDIQLDVRPCEGEPNCWTWSTFADHDGQPVALEARCLVVDGSRLEDGEVLPGLLPGENPEALGFTIRPPCRLEVFLPSVIRN